MPRLLFEKKGNAVWISHLDLMRLFQRAFQRAKLPLKHTQGFNPRPSVSIALPLSVGIESSCEMLDFDLDGCDTSDSEIKQRLNAALVEGIRVLDVYGNGQKIKYIAYLDCAIQMEYDAGIPENAGAEIEKLFSGREVIVTKHGKSGDTEQNIIPMICSLHAGEKDANTLELSCRICCQNPSLNPMQISAAIERYLPDFVPDYVKYGRKEVYDIHGNVFR